MSSQNLVLEPTVHPVARFERVTIGYGGVVWAEGSEEGLEWRGFACRCINPAG